MNDVRTTMIPAVDGTKLAVHEMGNAAARPVVLLHGLMSNANINWIKYGAAKRLVEAGFRCIMPDLRGHGQSDAPADPAAYPHDILVRDNKGIIAALGLEDYDLCGFSLGARTVAKLVIDGATPRCVVISGMGLEGLTEWATRRDYFLGVMRNAATVKRGDPGFHAVAFMRTTGIDPHVVGNVVDSFGDLDARDLHHISMPALILCGTEDRDNGSPFRLADALPNGRAVEIPGNHMSCVTKAEFGQSIADFLTAA